MFTVKSLLEKYPEFANEKFSEMPKNILNKSNGTTKELNKLVEWNPIFEDKNNFQNIHGEGYKFNCNALNEYVGKRIAQNHEQLDAKSFDEIAKEYMTSRNVRNEFYDKVLQNQNIGANNGATQEMMKEDLTTIKEVIGAAAADPDFKIVTHEGAILNSANFIKDDVRNEGNKQPSLEDIKEVLGIFDEADSYTREKPYTDNFVRVTYPTGESHVVTTEMWNGIVNAGKKAVESTGELRKLCGQTEHVAWLDDATPFPTPQKFKVSDADCGSQSSEDEATFIETGKAMLKAIRTYNELQKEESVKTEGEGMESTIDTSRPKITKVRRHYYSPEEREEQSRAMDEVAIPLERDVVTVSTETGIQFEAGKPFSLRDSLDGALKTLSDKREGELHEDTMQYLSTLETQSSAHFSENDYKLLLTLLGRLDQTVFQTVKDEQYEDFVSSMSAIKCAARAHKSMESVTKRPGFRRTARGSLLG